jgi:hypothetical protein
MPIALRADFDARSMRVAAKRAKDAAQARRRLRGEWPYTKHSDLFGRTGVPRGHLLARRSIKSLRQRYSTHTHTRYSRYAALPLGHI